MAQRWSVRKSMMVTLALAWVLSYADRVNMSVASIPMQAEFGWDETTKGLVMGSVFIGYIASQFVGGLLAARVALGVAEGFAVPATYAFIGRWSPVAERSRLLAIVVSGATIGAPGGLMLSGFIVETSGWPTAFYLFGVLGLIWATYWFRVAQDEPNDHPHISEDEKKLLAQSSVDTSGPQAIPYRKILTHPAVWAIIVNKFCMLWMVYVFLAWLPSYFSAVQGVSVAGSGLFAALPWIGMSLMLYVASGWPMVLAAK